jgi:N-acetylglutamate synthase-like GNAT family acetyltransferase
MNTASLSPDLMVRPLRRADLERVIAIDQAVVGAVRRRFMERRLTAAEHRPDEHLFVGVERGGILAGYALGRVLHGEFGRVEPVAVLDAMGVDPDSRDHGCGHALMEGMLAVLRHKRVTRLHSQADWTSHELLKFFHSMGFTLAQRVVLERDTSQALAESGDEI